MWWGLTSKNVQHASKRKRKKLIKMQRERNFHILVSHFARSLDTNRIIICKNYISKIIILFIFNIINHGYQNHNFSTFFLFKARFLTWQTFKNSSSNYQKWKMRLRKFQKKEGGNYMWSNYVILLNIRGWIKYKGDFKLKIYICLLLCTTVATYSLIWSKKNECVLYLKKFLAKFVLRF